MKCKQKMLYCFTIKCHPSSLMPHRCLHGDEMARLIIVLQECGASLLSVGVMTESNDLMEDIYIHFKVGMSWKSHGKGAWETQALLLKQSITHTGSLSDVFSYGNANTPRCITYLSVI